MKCPLLLSQDIARFGNQLTPDTDCLQVECAWWAPVQECCAVLGAAAVISEAFTVLQAINDARGGHIIP